MSLILQPNDKVKLNNAVKESVDSLVREDGEKQFRKDVAERMKAELEVPPAMFNAIVKERYNESATKRMEKDEEIIDINEDLLNASRHVTTTNP